MTVRGVVTKLAFLGLVVAIACLILLTVFRDDLFDRYMGQLDAWVRAGGDVKTLQTEVVATCGKLVLTQAGFIERLQLLTTYRNEYEFRMDVCTKMTVNRLYKQPEFEKPDLVSMICEDQKPFYELLRRLCRRSGLRSP